MLGIPSPQKIAASTSAALLGYTAGGLPMALAGGILAATGRSLPNPFLEVGDRYTGPSGERTIANLKPANRSHKTIWHKEQEVKIHYLERGQKNKSQGTLVLLHGLGSNMYEWNRVFDELTEKYHVIALDLPGHGYSGNIQTYDFIHDICPIMDSFFESMQLHQVSLAGSSMGGGISQLVAALYPDRVKDLLLFCSSGCSGEIEKTPTFVQAMRIADRLPPAKGLIAEFLEKKGAHFTLARYVHPTATTLNYVDIEQFSRPAIEDFGKIRARGEFARQIHALNNNVDLQTPFVDLQTRIKQRTWIIQTTADQVIPPSVPKKLKLMIQNSKLIWITPTQSPVAGHTPMSSDPVLILQLIAQFMSERTTL